MISTQSLENSEAYFKDNNNNIYLSDGRVWVKESGVMGNRLTLDWKQIDKSLEGVFTTMFCHHGNILNI